MAKERSPNYPAFDLEEAVECARKVFKEEGRSSAEPIVIVKALGYAGLSGSARQKLGAMRQYGLLEDAPQGKTQLTKRAVRLATHDQKDAEYVSAAREAALSPALFRELREQNPEASDRNLETHLINDRGFSPDGARRVVRSYRATLGFANLGTKGYNGEEDEANGGADEQQSERQGTDAPGAERKPHHEERPRGTSTVTYSWPLEDAERLEVAFVGSAGKKPTRRDLEAAIDYLELIKKRTPTAPETDEGGGE